MQREGRNAVLNYAKDSGSVPRFHANDHGLDTVALDPRPVDIVDARHLDRPPTLEREGGMLATFPSRVGDFRDDAEVAARYADETREFILDLTGADDVAVTGPGILRFSERSSEAGSRDNSDAARLIHSDASDAAARQFAEQANPRRGRRIVNSAQHNVWRSFSGPPQDMPLALCDYRSISPSDLMPAEAAFDRDGEVTWSFEALLFRYNPRHRWFFYSGMTPDEVLVFKRHDTDPALPSFLPHSAFVDDTVPTDTLPRASIEMRTIAYWYGEDDAA